MKSQGTFGSARKLAFAALLAGAATFAAGCASTGSTTEKGGGSQADSGVIKGRRMDGDCDPRNHDCSTSTGETQVK